MLTGQVGYFLRNFYPLVSKVPAGDVAEYTRVYSRPQVLHNGMDFYRDWPTVDENNAVLMRKPLAIPVRLLSMDLIPKCTALSQKSMKNAAPSATGTAVPGAGHWLAEDAPGGSSPRSTSSTRCPDRSATSASDPGQFPPGLWPLFDRLRRGSKRFNGKQLTRDEAANVSPVSAR